MATITHYETHGKRFQTSPPWIRTYHSISADVRFPTSLTGDGTDAMNTDCDYSSAYVSLLTNSDLVGHGMTFTIGRGNDIVSAHLTILYLKGFYLRLLGLCCDW